MHRGGGSPFTKPLVSPLKPVPVHHQEVLLGVFILVFHHQNSWVHRWGGSPFTKPLVSPLKPVPAACKTVVRWHRYLLLGQRSAVKFFVVFDREEAEQDHDERNSWITTHRRTHLWVTGCRTMAGCSAEAWQQRELWSAMVQLRERSETFSINATTYR